MDVSLKGKVFESGKDLLQKYKGAIIFLFVILFITILLVTLYLMLKKGFCCCCCNKEKEDEESLYTDLEHDEEDDEMEGHIPPPNGELLHSGEHHLEPEERAVEEQEHHIPEIIVTEGHFVPEKKSKKKQLSGMLKRMRPGKGKVRFSPSSEQISMISSEGSTITSDYGSTTNSLPIHRSDSMESFMSAVSAATTNNIDEFGDELSPSRLQVFLHYDPKLWTLTVGVKQADCLVSTTGSAMYWQAHVTILPFKKHRFKTKYKSTSTPIFNQNYEVENIAQQALSQLSVRYRIYGRPGRGGRKKLAGETEVELSHITQMEDMIIKDWRVLRRKGGPFIRHESEV
ncbi:uncharacterized protein [Clytia hemisphaerica]|uniref:C2 domain-containing protein n=1 Tax=Clytia hemisphaerica TaxID=252671 RepID=A0A7M5VC50_9CNID